MPESNFSVIYSLIQKWKEQLYGVDEISIFVCDAGVYVDIGWEGSDGIHYRHALPASLLENCDLDHLDRLGDMILSEAELGYKRAVLGEE